MTNPPSSKDLLGNAAKAFKFDAIGDVAQGTVISTVVRQVTKMGTGELEFFKSGDPKWQIIVTLQTTLREDPDDDGQRTLYVKSYMFSAVRQAVAATGADDLERGGYLTVVHTGLGEAERGLNPPKLFSAEYKRPSAQLLAGQAPAPQAPQQAYPQYAPGQPSAVQDYAAPAPAPHSQAAPQASQPAPQYAQAPVATQQSAPAPIPAPAAAPAAGPSPEQLAAVIRAGLDPAQVFPGYTPPQ
jgi:hypothetical protein